MKEATALILIMGVLMITGVTLVKDMETELEACKASLAEARATPTPKPTPDDPFCDPSNRVDLYSKHH